MSTLHGVELQRVNLFALNPEERSDRFYRVVRIGNDVHLRWGTRGTAGTTQKKHFPTSRDAISYARTAVTRKRLYAQYDWAYSSSLISVSDWPTPHTITDPESVFLDHWAQNVRTNVVGHAGDDMRLWIEVRGLLAELGKDHTADTLYTHLAAHPHAIDTAHDQIIGQVNHLPTFSTTPNDPTTRSTVKFTSGRGVQAGLLGSVERVCEHGTPGCAPCADRMAAMLGFVYRDHDIRRLVADARDQITATARNLVRLPSTSAPSRTYEPASA